MAKAIATYAGGINSLVQIAVRTDGKVFRRHQNKTPWGYRWSAWQARGQMVDPQDPPEFFTAGFSTVRRTNYYSSFNPRLPNE